MHSLATILGPPAGPSLLPVLPALYELYMDKGDVVRTAATSAAKAIVKLFPPESTRLIFRNLEENLDKAKWKGKVGILDALKSFVPTAKTQVADQLGETLPKVEAAMHDTKSEVRSPSISHDDLPTFTNRYRLPLLNVPLPCVRRWRTQTLSPTSRLS